jgi:small subunit ribosomal protein S16
MSVKIRLARYGTKKRPFYRIVVAPKEASRDGRFLERVGTYDPLAEPSAVVLKSDRIEMWMKRGAVPTDTVRNLLKREGFFSRVPRA